MLSFLTRRSVSSTTRFERDHHDRSICKNRTRDFTGGWNALTSHHPFDLCLLSLLFEAPVASTNQEVQDVGPAIVIPEDTTVSTIPCTFKEVKLFDS